MPQYWLMKTEPGDYSWSDLKQDGEAGWDGVKAPAARRNLSRMKPGDLALIYHTGTERAAVGVAEVTSLPYPDPEQPEGSSPVVNVAWRQDLSRPVTLKEIKESGLFPDWDLVRLPRLSVVPVSEPQWQKVMEWGRGEEYCIK
jgi:predicted RNA-binding protein with PUA-like domain